MLSHNGKLTGVKIHFSDITGTTPYLPDMGLKICEQYTLSLQSSLHGRWLESRLHKGER